jgi:hypothetical protein
MAELPRYQETGRIYSDLPSFDFANVREGMRLSQTLTNSLDRLSEFAQKTAEKDAERKAEEFAMGWLRDLPLASLQAPQSALLESIEGVRGNNFNILNALEPDKQRIPSETWGIENPYAAFAVDAVTDPELLTGTALFTKIPSKLPGLVKNLGEMAVNDIKDSFTLAKQLKQAYNNPGISFSTPDRKGNSFKIFDYLEQGSQTIDNALSEKIALLKTPEGKKRLIQQEYEYLKSIGFDERGINKQAEINADNRISELEHTRVFGNANANTIEGIDRRFLSKNIRAQSPATSLLRYNLIEYGIPGNNAHFAQSSPIPVEDIFYDNEALRKAIRLNKEYKKDDEIINIFEKLAKHKYVGGYEAPGDIALGLGFPKSKAIVNHEIQHGLQRGRTLAIDTELKKLQPKYFSELSDSDLGQLKYFTQGSKGKESSAFLSEARTAMKEAGLIKHDYEEITPEKVEEAFKFFKKNPRKIFIKEQNRIPYDELSQTRIFDIHQPTKDNFKILSDSFNKLPVVIPGILGVGAATQLGQEEIPQYKKGGIIKDDRGQWEHPGEITEINSPYITMKGVPYPVLGISDTGDTQMMYPEQEYKFEGNKVTEYPLAKNGKELVKLNQLINFTNYNTKQPGGWMDKYQ